MRVREDVREHAELVADYCTEIEPGDQVTIAASSAAEEFVVALHEAVRERGGDPLWIHGSLGTELPQVGEAVAAHLDAHEREFGTPEHQLALAAATDVYVAVRSATNRRAMDQVEDERLARRAAACEPVTGEWTNKARWCGTLYPTDAYAQAAGMSTPAYREFVYDAMLRDWEAVAERMEPFRQRLDAAERLHLEGEGVNLRMSLEGMNAISDTGKHNLPGGEVFTAPVPDSVRGTVQFDYPLAFRGAEIEGALLTFEDGEVTAFSADRNERALAALLSRDDGARRVGEVGFGMNEAIDRFTGNVLFDEKLAGTVHLALGRAYDGSAGEGRTGNESAVHVDFLADLEGVDVRLDGELVTPGDRVPGRRWSGDRSPNSRPAIGEVNSGP